MELSVHVTAFTRDVETALVKFVKESPFIFELNVYVVSGTASQDSFTPSNDLSDAIDSGCRGVHYATMSADGCLDSFWCK